MMVRPFVHFVLLISFIWVSTVTISSATSCNNDTNCPHHHLCINNKCSRGFTGTGERCYNSSDCFDQSVCLSNECSCSRFVSSYSCLEFEKCRGGICTERVTECTSSIDCEVNKICYNFKCIYCDNSSQCPDGQQCFDGKCDNVTFCTTTTECPGTRRCIFGSCTYPKKYGPCQNDLDCPDDQRCKPNMCVMRKKSSPLFDILIWIVGLSIGLSAKLCIIKYCRDSSSSSSATSTLLSPPPHPASSRVQNSSLNSATRAISVPNLTAPGYRIQMASSAPSSESSFDSKPPTYSEVCLETSEPPPEYNRCFKNLN